jgi:acyl-CoA-binding protein
MSKIMELDENFKFAVNQIRNTKQTDAKKPSDKEKLQFYALYKQATVGKCNIPQPWAVNVVERAKWEAWNGLGNMSSDTAKERYCALFLDTI